MESRVQVSDCSFIFRHVLALSRGNAIELTGVLAGLLSDLAEEFGNPDFGELCDSHRAVDLTINTACDILFHKSRCGVDFAREVGFLAANFPKCCQSIIDSKLPAPLLSDIFRHPSLKLTTEDSLYDVVHLLTETDANYFALFEFVHFEFLSLDTISRFMDISLPHVDQINTRILQRIYVRLRHTQLIPPTTELKPRFSGRSFGYSANEPFHGIIAHLTTVCGGNVHDHQIVTVSALTIYSGYRAKCVADVSRAEKYFCSPNKSDQWVKYDFKRKLGLLVVLRSPKPPGWRGQRDFAKLGFRGFH
jgi:hypothetical protein